MYVGGTVISSVEFHGNMSLVIFMSKCPLACRYCHNAELLDDNTQLSFEEIKYCDVLYRQIQCKS